MKNGIIMLPGEAHNMIFFPNRVQRYTSALRLYIQHSVLQKGLDRSHTAQLKKITLAEALASKNEISPVNINELSDSLLGTAQILMLKNGEPLKVELDGGGVFLINKQLYTALVLELVACGCEKITVISRSPNTVVKARRLCKYGNLPKIIKAMSGDLMVETKSGAAIIRLPSPSTTLKAKKTENEWYYLLDSFSPVNIWLK